MLLRICRGLGLVIAFFSIPTIIEHYTTTPLFCGENLSPLAKNTARIPQTIGRFWNFGRVKLSFSSKGFEKPEDVDASSITAKRILFTPSSELKSEIEKASFSRV
ncbi:hypothetical protein [uncultured Treponema sp.]|uniref:HU family DNA-binding protein n=1 Tax=uncultured Treponema sp. TaxID=162155 RepID=UPI0025F6BFD1|nr:hypothetical protein [Treponema sp. UBA3813]